MKKKYFPYILLLAAALSLFIIKKNQRGGFKDPTGKNTDVNSRPYFNRKADRIIYSSHAQCRMKCRHIDESEVLEILETGKINESRIEQDDRGETYPLEGITHDNQFVRVVFAPKGKELVVVTVIDLNKDWYCDCK